VVYSVNQSTQFQYDVQGSRIDFSNYPFNSRLICFLESVPCAIWQV